MSYRARPLAPGFPVKPGVVLTAPRPPGTFTALTVRQPFAWLICDGQKRIENRSRHTEYRGQLLIHAAQVGPTRAELEDLAEEFGEDWKFPLDPAAYDLGYVIGVVNLCGCGTADKYGGTLDAVGPYCWNLMSAAWLRDPIPAKGQLGLWKFYPPLS